MIPLLLAAWVTGGAPQYRATVAVGEGRVVAFELALFEDHALIKNGEEVIRAPLRNVPGSQPPSRTIDFPHFDSQITFQTSADGLRGRWALTRRDGVVAKLDFVGQPVTEPVSRYPRTSKTASPPVAATWRMDFEKSGLARGECATVKGEIRCTVLTPTGDYRYLAGTLDGDRLRLSVFDGAHAFLFDARLSPDGSKMSGDFYSGAHWHERFTAVPAQTVPLPDGFAETKLTAGTRLSLPALDDPRFAGKAVIVEIFGSWCPNCHDAAALLAQLQARHGPMGLALLGVAFEHTTDAARSQRQIERFSARHGLDWKVVVAGTSGKDAASKALPQLDRVRSYPTTIFLDRDRTVRAIHTGFSGPATGATYAKLVADFERLTSEILASSP